MTPGGAARRSSLAVFQCRKGVKRMDELARLTDEMGLYDRTED